MACIRIRRRTALEVYLIDPDGRNEISIFRSNLSGLDTLTVFRPAWSPDSQRLVFIAPWKEGEVGLMKIGADGEMQTAFRTDGLTGWWSPVWSPDGNSLLFGAREKRRPVVIEPEAAIFFMNLDSSESRHFMLPGISELLLNSDNWLSPPNWSFRRLVWAPDGSQLMLSIGQIGIDTPQEKRLYLIDIASKTIRLWMDDAEVADWVRPGFVHTVNPREKRISTWAELKKKQTCPDESCDQIPLR